jgi:hypothetical protein
VLDFDVRKLGFRDGHRVADDDPLAGRQVVQVDRQAPPTSVRQTKRAENENNDSASLCSRQTTTTSLTTLRAILNFNPGPQGITSPPG